MQNSATFLRSTFNLNDTFVQMCHLKPSFTRKPVSILYEISGTDGLIHEGEIKITESNKKSQIITFECKLDETYFCKVTGFFNESKTAMQTIRLFYKVEDDTDTSFAGKNDSKKFGFRKINQDDNSESELDEENDLEDEVEEEDEDEVQDDDDDGITLEMRVEQLKKFTNYFSDE